VNETVAMLQDRPEADVAGTGVLIIVAGTVMVADCDGALYWPQERLLAFADLHFEKGSSFAQRGVLLPPYDTAATLGRVARLIVRYAPRVVLALGDSFHDDGGAIRLSAPDRSALAAIQQGRDWVWIKGNHDSAVAANIGGAFHDRVAIGPLIFRHDPTGGAGEIAGHLHPMARVGGRGGTLRRRCFACDGRRLLMPAFGAFTGGLNVRHPAIVDVFGGLGFTAFVLGSRRLYAVPAFRCRPD
jgi:uncharacterized protein